MEQYINAAALTPRTLLMLFIAVGAAYFFFKATKHLVKRFARPTRLMKLSDIRIERVPLISQRVAC